jgi:hypothetical protein
MNHKLTGSLCGALLLLILALAGPAGAAAPANVSVRIEGAGATLLPQTSVQTTAASRLRGQKCPGSSAAAALDTAAHGQWGGSFSTSQKDFFVTSILGETPTGNNFWTLWVNGRSSSTGACSTPLHPGDHELWFDCVADANFNCTNNPLSLAAPAVVRAGSRATISVVQLDGAGHSTPTASAAVFGAGVSAVTGSGGRATIVPRRLGVFTLQASKSGATPSDPVFVCVYAHSPSSCGAARSGPPTHVLGIAEHQVFTHGPRTLHGTAGPDPSGLTDVSLSLRRRVGGHCRYFDGNTATWHAVACGAPIPSFSVGAGASWSYLLPGALPPGVYRLEAIARDGNGRQTKPARGSSLVDFTVRAKHR